MSFIMKELSTKSQIKKIEKRNRRFSVILRHLAKFDNSIKIMKVTISEDRITSEKDRILIAPSKFGNCFGHLSNHYSTENTNSKYITENLNIENNDSTRNNIIPGDYPDSSDFSDDD